MAFDVVAFTFFLLFFVLGLLASQRKLGYLFRRDFMIVDVCTLLPILTIMRSNNSLVLEPEPHSVDVWVAVIRLLLVTRILYVFHMHRLVQSEITRQIFL